MSTTTIVPAKAKPTKDTTTETKAKKQPAKKTPSKDTGSKAKPEGIEKKKTTTPKKVPKAIVEPVVAEAITTAVEAPEEKKPRVGLSDPDIKRLFKTSAVILVDSLGQVVKKKSDGEEKDENTNEENHHPLKDRATWGLIDGMDIQKENIPRIIRHGVYDEIRYSLHEYLDGLLKDMSAYSEHDRRKTYSVEDVHRALEKRGEKIYFVTRPPSRKGKKAKKTTTTEEEVEEGDSE
jgi:histone H3/H4